MVYLNTGKDSLKIGDLDQAVTNFTKAIEVAANFELAYEGRATAYFKKEDFDRAIFDLTKAIEMIPGRSQLYALRAICYFKKQEYDKSWEDVQKAESLGLKAKPEFLEGLKKASGREN